MDGSVDSTAARTLDDAMTCSEFIAHWAACPQHNRLLQMSERAECILRSVRWGDLQPTGREWMMVLGAARFVEEQAAPPTPVTPEQAEAIAAIEASIARANAAVAIAATSTAEAVAAPATGVGEKADDEAVCARLTGSALSPETIVSVLAECANFAGREFSDSDWVQRIIVSKGLTLAAANAARRAWERAGTSWPLVEQVERFLAPHVDSERSSRARGLISDAQRGELVEPSEDDYDAMLDGRRETSAVGRCLALVEARAVDLAVDGCDEDAHGVSLDAFEIAYKLATQVSESAAREFVATIESLNGARHG